MDKQQKFFQQLLKERLIKIQSNEQLMSALKTLVLAAGKVDQMIDEAENNEKL